MDRKMKIMISVSKIPVKFQENVWYAGNLEQDYKGKPKGSNVAWRIRFSPNKDIVTIMFDGKQWFEYLHSSEVDALTIIKPFKSPNGEWVMIGPNVARNLDRAFLAVSQNSRKLTVQR